MNTPHKQYPAVQGLTWHRTQYYSFFLPMNWHPFSWANDREGQIYGPDSNDSSTVFAVDMIDLGTPITDQDFDILAEGFFGTIEQLPACAIEARHQKAIGRLFELEAKYTFQEQAKTRKRWTRVFYHETRQVTMTAQGSTHEQYDHWLPWFFEAMITAKVHSQYPETPE